MLGVVAPLVVVVGADTVGADSVAEFDDVPVSADVLDEPVVPVCTSAVVAPWLEAVVADVFVCCVARVVKVATPMKLMPIKSLRTDLTRRASISRWVGPMCGGTARSSWYQSGNGGRFGVVIEYLVFPVLNVHAKSQSFLSL